MDVRRGSQFHHVFHALRAHNIPVSKTELWAEADKQFKANGKGVYSTYQLLTVFARRAAE